MNYKGFLIKPNYGHYEIYEGKDLIATADTMSEAREVCDDIDSEIAMLESAG